MMIPSSRNAADVPMDQTVSEINAPSTESQHGGESATSEHGTVTPEAAPTKSASQIEGIVTALLTALARG